MKPRDFLDQVVAPNLDEFQNQFDQLRPAFNAVMAVDALAAHIFYWLKDEMAVPGLPKNDLEYRHELAERNAAFKLVRDMAKAQKHVRLERGTPSLSTAAQVAAGNMGWGEGGYGEGPYGGGMQVVVTLDGGYRRSVEAIVTSGLEFLKQEMDRHGLLREV